MPTFPHGHALLIGIGTYAYERHMNLPTTAADAEALAAVLRDPHYCGYPPGQVTLCTHLSATREDVLNSLDELAKRVQPGDTVLLFYSGHGDYGSDGTYYLTTHDTKVEQRKVVPGTGVSQQELLERLRKIQAKCMLLLFNACHSGNISPVLGPADTPETLGVPVPEQTASALLATGSGRIIITACREQQVSYVGWGQQTFFTLALLAALRGEDIYSRAGYISAFDLYTALYENVTRTVEREVSAAQRQRYGNGRQEPELTVLKGVGPFAVALYQGSSVGSGVLGGGSSLPNLPTVRQVDAADAQRAYNQIQSGRDTNIAGRDNIITNIGGDQINAQESQGFINRPSGPVSQHFGDRVRQSQRAGRDIVNSPQVQGSGNVVTGSNQTINNEAPNQGAQGNFSGPVTFNRQDARGSNIAQASDGSTASVNVGGQTQAPIAPGDAQLAQRLRQQLTQDLFSDLLLELENHITFEPATLGTTQAEQVGNLIRLCRQQRKRAALVESIIAVDAAVLGSQEAQQAWRAWARQQDNA
ncbi:MAG: caspase family protein [Chloroflexaceae bacterium]|nr:caspase family protein [Chloroflexaceae bacterium]